MFGMFLLIWEKNMLGVSAIGDFLVGLYPVVDLLGASVGALL